MAVAGRHVTYTQIVIQRRYIPSRRYSPNASHLFAEKHHHSDLPRLFKQIANVYKCIIGALNGQIPSASNIVFRQNKRPPRKLKSEEKTKKEEEENVSIPISFTLLLQFEECVR